MARADEVVPAPRSRSRPIRALDTARKRADMSTPSAAYLERCRRREARHLRRIEKLEADFEKAESVESELRINKQINQAAKAASKAVQRRLRYERTVRKGSRKEQTT